MVDLNNLRAVLSNRVDICQQRLENAKREAAAAISSVERLEKELSAVRAEVDSRLAAIALVEQMLKEADQRANPYPYRGMNQEAAMRVALLNAERPLNSAELAESLIAGGYEFTSKNPANSIVVAANTNRKQHFTTSKDGHRTLIGLKEWGRDGMEPPNPFDDLNDTNDLSDIGLGSLGYGPAGV